MLIANERKAMVYDLLVNLIIVFVDIQHLNERQDTTKDTDQNRMTSTRE